MSVSKNRFWFTIHVTLILFLTSSCVVQKSPVTGKKHAYAYTWQQEIQIGQKADQEIQQQYGIYDNPKLSEYVNKVGQEVLAKSDLKKPGAPAEYRDTKFTFRVLNSSVVNAFALPGGYIYVTRGLLAYLDNEAQLAVVLGHEIGHVAARHSSQKAFQEKIGQVALIGGAVVGEQVFGVSGQDILNAAGTATKLLFLRYSRDDEREADRLGVEYAAKAGFKSSEAAHFFTSLKRMSQQQGSALPSLWSTHPDPGDREQTIPKLADQWKAKGIVMSRVDQSKYLDEINGIVYGDNPREGFRKNGMFYHPDLKFEFPVPSEWSMSNEASRVAFISKDQDAIMMLQVYSNAKTSSGSVATFLKQNELTVVKQEEVSHDNSKAYLAEATAKTQENTELEFFIYALPYNGQIYRFIDYTTEAKYPSYKAVFANSSSKFAPLTNQQILSVKPVRVNVIKTNGTKKFADWIPKSLPDNLTMNDVAIMNQKTQNETIAAGSYIKIPEK